MNTQDLFGKHERVFLALSTAFTFLCCGVAHADEWTGKDKAGHAQVGALIGSLTTAISQSATAGCLMAAGAGLAKEIYDAQHPDKHTASFKDFAITSISGCLSSAATGLVIGPRFIGWKKEF